MVYIKRRNPQNIRLCVFSGKSWDSRTPVRESRCSSEIMVSVPVRYGGGVLVPDSLELPLLH